MVSIANTTTAGEQSGPVTVAIAGGGYFVAWYDNAFADPAGQVRGQFYDAAGAKVGGQLTIGTSPVNGNSWIDVPPLSAVALADGKVAVSWNTEEGTIGQGASGSDIVQSIVASNGVTTSAGPQSVVNAATAGNQSPPVMTATSDGGYFTAWYGNDSSVNFGQGTVFGQYYNANGVKIGGELNIGTALVNENSWSNVAPLTVTALQDGKVIVGWQTEDTGASSDGSGSGVAQVITTSNGTVTSAGPQSFMNTVTAGDPSPPQIVATPDGGYFATWWSNDSSTANGQGVLKGQYFDANGAKIGSETQLTTWQVNGDATNLPYVDLAVLTNGSIVVGFQTENGAGGASSTTEVGYVMVSRAGAVVSVTPQALMNTSQAGHQSPPVLTALPSGGFFAAWYDNALSDPGGVVRGQYFDASGARLGTELNLGNRVETWQNGEMPEISVVALADDRVAINWMTEAADDVDGSFTAVVTHVAASPFVDGTAANDVIGLAFTDDDGQFVSLGADTIYGYGGNDLIDGSGGNDIIFGGGGNDSMFGANGSNTLDGGAGSDMVSFAPHENYVNVDLNTGVAAHTFVSTGTVAAVVNTTAAGEQSGPVSVQTSDGGVFIAWYDNALSDPAGQVRGQFYDAAGAKVGGQLTIGTSPVNGNSWIEVPPLSAVALADGKVAVSWNTEEGTIGQGASGSDIVQSIVTSNGVTTSVGPQSVVNAATAGNQSPPVMTATSDGGYFAAWYMDDSSTASGQGWVRGQYFDANGAKIGGELLIGTSLVNENSWSNIAPLTVTALQDGKVVVGWQTEDTGPSSDGSGTGITQVIASSNGTVTSAGQQSFMNTVTAGNQSPPQIVATPDGGYFATWWSNDSSTGNGQGVLKGQYFDANGAKIGSEAQLTTWQVYEDPTNQPYVDLAVLTNGTVVVGFQTENGAGGPTSTTEAGYVMVSRAGTQVSITPQALMNTNQVGNQSAPVVVALEGGGFFAAWYDNALSNPGGVVRGQYFDVNGARIGAELTFGAGNTASTETDSLGEMPSLTVVALAGNNVAVSWVTDGSSFTDGNGSAVVTARASLTNTNSDTLISIENITGSGFGDVITGNGANNAIFGGGGNDTITAGAGADTISGGDGNDLIHLGDDSTGDVIIVSNGHGRDTIAGLDAPVANGDGTFTGIDKLDVSSLNDSQGFPVNVADVVVTANHNGDAVLTFPNGEAVTFPGIDPTTASNWAWLEAIGIPPVGPVDGTLGNDAITPTSGAGGTPFTDAQGDSIDTIDGLNDTVFGYGGNDLVQSGLGDDLVYGGIGRDTLEGGIGNDTLSGDAGNDLIIGGTFAPQTNMLTNGTFEGGTHGTAQGGTLATWDSWNGATPDLVRDGVSEWFGIGRISPTDGQQYVALANTNQLPAYQEGLFQNLGTPLVAGHTYTLSFDAAGLQDPTRNNQNYSAPGTASFQVWGSATNGVPGSTDNAPAGWTLLGQVTVSGDTMTNYSVSFAPGFQVQSIAIAIGQFSGDNAYITVDRVSLLASPVNDAEVSGNDVLLGGDGSDTLYGTGGNDTLNGGTGNDALYGGDDRDLFVIEDGFGLDTIYGGAGGNDFDTLDASALTTNASLTFSAHEAGTLTSGGNTATFADIENIILGAGNDTVNAVNAALGIAIDTGAGNDSITAGAGNDTIATGAGNDTVNAGAGNDSVDGGVGNDSILGGAGADSLLGGDGADTVDGGIGDDLITGGAGNDSLVGGDGADTVDGGIGDDIIAGGAGNDSLSGGDGADTVDGGTGDDIITGGAGNDSLSGGDGADTVDGGIGDDIIAGGAGNDSLSGGDGADTVDGGIGDDLIAGGAGNDSLSGGDGADTVDGGIGDDIIAGGAGNDSLSGGDGADTVDGGIGDDIITGGAGNDSLVGGDGADTVDGGIGDDSLSGGDGADSLSGGLGSDTLNGGAGNDTLDGGDGDDRIIVSAGDVAYGGSGDDVFTVDPTQVGTTDVTIFGGETSEDLTDPTNGGAGDVLDLRGLSNVTVTYGGGNNEAGTAIYQNTGGQMVTITFAQIETVLVDQGDVVNGTVGSDTMGPGYTDADGDRLDGADGLSSDTISAGAGNDVVDAGFGNDTVFGGIGNDSLFGNVGNDSLLGDGGDDTVLGGTGDDTLEGGDGNDSLDSGVGNDVLDGGSGTDTLIGGDGDDVVYGGLGSDTLSGGPGNDTLYGGDGDDALAVGGSDFVYGGGGDEVFTVDASDLAANINVTIVGGETSEDLTDPTNGGAGDVLDLSNQSNNLTVDLSANPETGTVNGLDADSNADITFAEIEIIRTGAGNDTVNGALTTGPVHVDTGAGMDVITTGAGDDSILSGDGRDSVSSGGGNDTIYAGQDYDTVDGGAGDDLIYGGTGFDSLFGGTGNDVIWGEDGADTLYGGAGEDSLYGGTGDDQIDAGDGADSVDAGSGNDTIYGGLGNDTILAGSGSDLVDGGAGDDSVVGGFGNDVLAGAAGNDTLTGDEGNDSLDGGAGDDVLDGGIANDTLYGGLGNDTVYGGDGDDFINTRTISGTGLPDIGLTHPTNPALSYPSDATPDDDRDLVYGGAGNDTILSGDDRDTVYGGLGNESIDAGFDDDYVEGGDGADTLAGNEGRDTIYGGAGDDVISGGLSQSDPAFAQSLAYDLLDEGGFDPLPNNNTDLLYGGDGNDVIYGGDDADIMYGGADNDTLHGGIDDDLVFGDAGDDYLLGEQGNDTLFGGLGNDTLDGGDSVDTVDGGIGDDIIAGGAGNDALDGGDGHDTVDGGTGDDIIAGGAGNDSLGGGDGADNLSGGAGNDMLDGGAGDDVITFGAGDVAYGGGGDDTFRINPNLLGAGAITIVGGTTDEDGAGDVLDLTGGRNVQVVYNQTDPTWNGTIADSGTASYLNAADETVTINFSEINSVVVCFAGGTMIDTAEGERAIETLLVGDLVRTADHAFQPIRWIGCKTVAAEGLVAPILIKAGALGNNRDLRVSPQHRMLLGGWETEMLFGEPEVLMAAKHLVNDSTIVRETGGEVEYFHMLFDCHEIVFSNGIPSESFHPGLEGWGALSEAARAEILHLFPQLARDHFSNFGQSARHSLKAHEAKVLATLYHTIDNPPPRLRKYG